MNPIKEKYANYELIPIELSLLDNTDDMVEQIVEKRLIHVLKNMINISYGFQTDQYLESHHLANI